jgi:hypothetical protein
MFVNNVETFSALVFGRCAPMSTSAYNEILRRARQELSAQEKLKLINELCVVAGSGRHTILELEGLGKHLWEGVDPDDYVRKERDSWSG